MRTWNQSAWNPPAIVWTDPKPAPQYAAHVISPDIQTIQSWIIRQGDLAGLRKLRDDWDGFGADAPNPNVIEAADYLMRMLKCRDVTNPPRRVTLSPNGEIALEWVSGSSLIRAEVIDSKKVEWMVVVPGQPTRFSVEIVGFQTSGEEQTQTWQRAPVATDEPSSDFEP